LQIPLKLICQLRAELLLQRNLFALQDPSAKQILISTVHFPLVIRLTLGTLFVQVAQVRIYHAYCHCIVCVASERHFTGSCAMYMLAGLALALEPSACGQG